VRAEAAATATVDTTSPEADSATKGSTWRATDRGPVARHTHRRLSSKDGTVPTAVATTLAAVAGVPTSPTSTARVTRLVDVATSDTAE